MPRKKTMDDLCFYPCRFLTKRPCVHPQKQKSFNLYRKKIHAIANKCILDWHLEYGKSERKEFQMLKPKKHVLFSDVLFEDFKEKDKKRKIKNELQNEFPKSNLKSECDFKRFKKE